MRCGGRGVNLAWRRGDCPTPQLIVLKPAKTQEPKNQAKKTTQTRPTRRSAVADSRYQDV